MNRSRSERRHFQEVMMKRAMRKYPYYEETDKTLKMLANTNIWRNFERKFGRPAKLSEQKATLSFREQLKEFSLAS